MKNCSVRQVVTEEMKQRGLSKYKVGALDRILAKVDPDILMSPVLVDLINNLLKGEEV